MTVSPHQEQAETWIILERHKTKSSVKPRVRYQLFHFFEGRVAIKNGTLKESENGRKDSEILSDLIVFEKNDQFENYILSFESLDDLAEDEIFTLSVFSFTEV